MTFKRVVKEFAKSEYDWVAIDYSKSFDELYRSCLVLIMLPSGYIIYDWQACYTDKMQSEFAKHATRFVDTKTGRTIFVQSGLERDMIAKCLRAYFDGVTHKVILND